MKLVEVKLTVRKEGYVSNEDELDALCTEAMDIIEPYFEGLREKLERKGFIVEDTL